MSKAVEYNATQIQSVVRLFDLISMQPALGVLPINYPNLVGYWRRDFRDLVVFPITARPTESPWEEGGFSEISDGYYCVGTPNEAFIGPELDSARGAVVSLSDDNVDFLCVAAYHPLQAVLEAVTFSVTGGLYCTREDLYDVFGKVNVWKWANIDSLPTDDPNYQTIIEQRIDKAITYSTADINDKLRGGPYSIPFVEDTLTATINQACAMKAGVWLYEWRGADDLDYENGQLTHRYLFMMHRADTLIEQVRRDSRRLDTNQSSSRAPGAG